MTSNKDRCEVCTSTQPKPKLAGLLPGCEAVRCNTSPPFRDIRPEYSEDSKPTQLFLKTLTFQRKKWENRALITTKNKIIKTQKTSLSRGKNCGKQ